MWGMGHFQRDCKYDGDKPTDSRKEQEGSFDSYDPVVGKWMTNLVATTPITAKAMKSLYAELNRQKDLKRTYRRRYKDLQAVVATTTDTPVTVLCPTIVTSSKTTPNIQVVKTSSAGQQKKTPDRGKAKPLGKVKKNVKTTPNTTSGPSVNLHSQLRDKAKHTACLDTRNNRGTPSNRGGIFQKKIRIQMPLKKVIWNKKIVKIHLLKVNNDCVQVIRMIRLINKINIKFLKTRIVEQEINHTEEVIIGTEQGTTFPTKIGTTMCNALIDTGTTKSCIQ